MELLTPDEYGDDVTAKNRVAALDGRERDADARDRAADRLDDIAAKREAMLDHREDAVQALLVRRVLERLFPHAPSDGDPWQILLQTTGRAPDRPVDSWQRDGTVREPT